MVHCEDDGEAEREGRGLPLKEGEALGVSLSVKNREAEGEELSEGVRDAEDEEHGDAEAREEGVRLREGVRLPEAHPDTVCEAEAH